MVRRHGGGSFVLRLISFDIDGTLEAGDPPGAIPMELVRQAKAQGWLVGSCSDRPVSAQQRMWAQHQIEADFAVTKPQLGSVRSRWQADAYLHIGDTDVDRQYAGWAGFDFLHVDEIHEHGWLMNLHPGI